MRKYLTTISKLHSDSWVGTNYNRRHSFPHYVTPCSRWSYFSELVENLLLKILLVPISWMKKIYKQIFLNDFLKIIQGIPWQSS